MKFYNLTLTAIILFVTGLICEATTLIVDNHVPTPLGTYATIQLAHNAASAGDTILLTPSDGGYTGINVTKPIHIVGNGWARPSASVPNTKTTDFSFGIGSAGSSITACEVIGNFVIYTNKITIKRSKCNWISVAANCSDVIIIQNLLIGIMQSNSNRAIQTMIDVASNCEVFISNNVIINQGTISANHALVVACPSTSIICNNILSGEEYSILCDMSGIVYAPNSVFNNIVLNGGIYGIATSNNNIGNNTQFTATDGNQQNVDMNDVFVDATNFDFHLKAGSPAIDAGFNGTDCGIYGGDLGFVNNGRSELPFIYYLDVPVTVDKKDGLNVTIKAKSGN
jgi:hypothetical protein